MKDGLSSYSRAETLYNQPVIIVGLLTVDESIIDRWHNKSVTETLKSTNRREIEWSEHYGKLVCLSEGNIQDIHPTQEEDTSTKLAQELTGAEFIPTPRLGHELVVRAGALMIIMQEKISFI